MPAQRGQLVEACGPQQERSCQRQDGEDSEILLEAANLGSLSTNPSASWAAGADVVIDERIGTELGAALIAAPLLGGRDQRGANTPATILRPTHQPSR